MNIIFKVILILFVIFIIALTFRVVGYIANAKNPAERLVKFIKKFKKRDL